MKQLLKHFNRIRRNCTALQVLVPDSEWDHFEKWHLKPDLIAWHQSIALIAFRDGYLRNILEPIKMLIRPTGQLPTKQYESDLIEKWMYKVNPFDRHKNSRIFLGRIVELQVAYWLTKEGWDITNLEAWDSTSSDIEASKGGIKNLLEVKYIGTSDTDFNALLGSIAGENQFTTLEPKCAANYLLFRISEAANQLYESEGIRTVAIVVDSYSWSNFTLAANILDSLRYFDSETWDQFASKQKYNPKGLLENLMELNEIWILKRNHSRTDQLLLERKILKVLKTG